ncbi:HD domain-containing protein [Pseudobacteroides cellulosolvens]|uniref:Ppx/GppA phosphatase n=1 Tax=Pseudobacteroides cellulosolvens ATCC 35603 = DSM 2933 TaxID=398512 RepID=A0A0L6JJM0_9FIRM|nr:HD domain-containing protein [Pseudobacteroides cellulosolvens]KNY25935.1 Ppx/GppA phosphatase [Pseudobacteroides cellulosolvens ATCC 35603 = DSM 2933]
MVRKIEVVAALDIGSNLIRMSIAQIDANGQIEILEDVEKSTYLGRDSFSYGKIQNETIMELCETLKGYTKLMKDYRIKNYRVVATSAIREAKNRDYLLDQVKLQTGVSIDVINNAKERYYMYKALRDYLLNTKFINKKDSLIVDIRSGGVEVSVYSDNRLKFTEYLKIGSLRLREVLADLQKRSLHFSSVLQEYIKSEVDFLKSIIKGTRIDNFIGIGGELKTILKLCEMENVMEENLPDSIRTIGRDTFERLFDKINHLTTEQIQEKFNLQKNKAEILLPSMVLFRSFLHMTESDGIYAPFLSLRNGILAEIADQWHETPRKKKIIDDIINLVWNIGKKYFVDEHHSAYIEKTALSIFDQTLKLHNLGNRERFCFRVSAILHDIGKYINYNSHEIHSYNIIQYQDIMGFSDRELKLIANVVRYHEEDLPDPDHKQYSELDERDRLTVSKLAAILRLAEALDVSHKQKITAFEIAVNKNELLFKVSSKEDIMLEQWSFSQVAGFFEDVMGVRPKLILKRI